MVNKLFIKKAVPLHTKSKKQQLKTLNNYEQQHSIGSKKTIRT